MKNPSNGIIVLRQLKLSNKTIKRGISMAHKYQEISKILEDQIISGDFDQKLPTEDELIQTYEVSRNTIRKAIEILVKKGYIIPIQGSGLFIRDVASNGVNLENFRGLTSDYPNHEIGTKLLIFTTINAPEDIAHAMKCPVGTELYHVVRLRTIDSVPWVIEYSYFNKTLIPYLNREIIEHSIYHYIRKTIKNQLGYVDRMIEAGRLGAHDAHLLGLEEGDPSLISINKAMFKTGEIFDYSINIHNFKHARFLKLSNFL